MLEIDLGAVAANWRTLSARHSSGAVAGVVKADGYGLGAREVVARLHDAGCRHFFTAHAAEAMQIRDLAPESLIAALNGPQPGTERAHAEAGLVAVLNSLGAIEAWATEARRLGRALPAILHVDTGMNRLGLPPAEVDVLAADPARLDGIALRYVMTHLASADRPEDPLNQLQRQRFAAACARLPAVPRSLANSSGIFLDCFGSDLARPGAALYGVNPTPGRANPMRQVVRLLARVLQLRDLPAGEGVGYHSHWIAPRPSRIATVAVGYADGFPRVLSGRAQARFDGKAVPLVGRVSMDLATFDVTDHPGVSAGSWLELIGPDNTPDDLAARAGTIGYEILTSLGQRYLRRTRG